MNQLLRKAATSLLLIVLVAFGARAGFAWHQARQLPEQVLSLVPFKTEAGHIAYSIASGKGFSSPFQRDSGPTAWLAPVYPYLLAGIFKLFGTYTLASFFAAILLNILFSAGTCIPIYYTGKRIAGLAAGSTAAWLWAIFPNAILIPYEWIWDTSLSALLLAALVWATLELPESRGVRSWGIYGLLWGLGLLTNPSVALLFPVFLLWAGYRAKDAGRGLIRLRRPALTLAIAFFCCVPWTIRNYILFHKAVPIRSNFAFELYVGNNENYDEKYRYRPGPVTQGREILRYLRMGETAFLEEEWRKATVFIESHPRVELWLVEQRLVDFWTGTATPVATFRSVNSVPLRILLLCNDAAALGTLAGIVILLAGRNAYAFPIAAVPIIFPLTYYITHTSLRYRHPIDPVVLLLTTIGVLKMREWAAHKGLKRAAAQGSMA